MGLDNQGHKKNNNLTSKSKRIENDQKRAKSC